MRFRARERWATAEVKLEVRMQNVAELSFSAGKSELLIRREVVRYETARHCTEQGSTVHAKIVYAAVDFHRI